MSAKANPAAIGGFFIGGLVIATVLIAFLASGSLFAERATYVSYFEGSAGGLDVGSDVKFRGVNIGRVADISLHAPGESAWFIRVLYDLDVQRVAALGVDTEDFGSLEQHSRAIERGMRAQLEVSSFVTGKLYIELDFLPDTPVTLIDPEGPYREVPTYRKEGIGERAVDVLSTLAEIDTEGISDALLELLETVNNRIEDVDVPALLNSANRALDSIADLAESKDLAVAFDKLPDTLEEYRLLAATTREQVGPLLSRIDSTAAELGATVVALRSTVEQSNAMLDPESTLRYSLEQSLLELAAAARAFRELADFLERNPRALLTGRPDHDETANEKP
jgi:paraquat-inducible protein B